MTYKKSAGEVEALQPNFLVGQADALDAISLGRVVGHDNLENRKEGTRGRSVGGEPFLPRKETPI